MSGKIIYIVGGRSFSSANPGRKISEVISVWKRLNLNLKVYFGKDIFGVSQEANYGSQDFHNSRFRKNKYLQFFIHSLSELKDIIHDRKIEKYIENKEENTLARLVWERSSRLHWSGLRIARKRKIPFVLEWKDHLVDYRFSLFKWYAQYIERLKMKRADYIVVESEVLKTELSKQGANPNKIHVALNAVNPHEFVKSINEGNKLKQKIGIPKENIVIGYLGSYAFYHNTVLLIQAANTILEKHNKVSFLLVGNGKDFQLCKDTAKGLKLFEKGLIMLDGVPKEKVPGVLSAIDISVLPGSTDIICPIKIMEYMAAETAVVVPDYLCNREVINKTNGILFTPENHQDLVAKLDSLIKDKNSSILLEKNARQYVINNLTWEQTWGKVLIDILKNENIN